MPFIQGSNMSVSVLLILVVISACIGAALMHWYTRIRQMHVVNETSLRNDCSVIPPLVDSTSQHQNAHLSQRLKSVIKDVANSQYVLADKQSFGSIFQTPLRDNIRELRDISNTLLAKPSEYNYHEGGKKFSKSAPVTYLVSEVLTQVRDSFAPICSSRGVSLIVHFDVLDDMFYADEWLHRIIRELLLNALKSNKNPITLRLHVSKSENDLLINVCDNGKGVIAANTNLVNHPLPLNFLNRRAEDQHTDTNLLIIKDHLQSIGGTISIKSALAFGTHVNVRLPFINKIAEARVEMPVATSQAPDSTPWGKYNTVCKKLLVIDQEFGYLHNIAQSLRKTYMVKTVHCVEDAITFLNSGQVDCILFDAELDLHEGMSLKDYLSVSADPIDIPFIMLGQKDVNLSQVRLLRSGINANVEKPITHEALSIIITNVIGEHEKVQHSLETAIAQYHSTLLSNSEHIAKQQNEFILSFTDFLESHYTDEKLTRPKAAALLFMTEKTLSRRLSKNYDLGFCEMLKRYRLQKAKERIAQGEQITTVAYDCGFSSPSYFTQCFRVEYGFAPSMLFKLKSA